ncbi:site-2 protease family protein [Kamptonema cortianum]|nr:site-2 protease family protein [Kamptonema cortianum]
MQSAWRIGSLFGIPLLIDLSWFLILILVSVINALDFATKWGPIVGASMGLVMALLLFGSVLLHELGHSLVARSQGIPVNSITLFLFGGVAAIDRESRTPGEALQVAIAGPLVSLSLAGLLRLVALALPQSALLYDLAMYLSTLNLVVALFNLIPGLPLDGGQILKSAIWKFTGNRFQAVRWAARIGQCLGGLAIACGILLDLLTEELFSGFWMALLGWFCLRNALFYYRTANIQETLLNLTAQTAMNRNVRTIEAEMTLSEFAQFYLQEADPARDYFVTKAGHYRGRISLEAWREVERSQWDLTAVESLVPEPLAGGTILEKSSLLEAINALEGHCINNLVVLNAMESPVGTLNRKDILKAVVQALNLSVSEGQIQQVHEQGQYPPNLQLQAIARSTL